MRGERDVVADAHQPARQTCHRTVRMQTIEVVASLFPVFGAVPDDVISND